MRIAVCDASRDERGRVRVAVGHMNRDVCKQQVAPR